MTYKTELQTYIATLDETIDNVGTLGAKLDDFSRALKIASNVVKAVDKVGELAHTTRNAVDAQLTLLKLTKLAGPLKAPSKILEKVLDKVKPVVDKIDDTIAKLNGKKDGSGSGDDAKGEFLEKLGKALDKAGTSLKVIAQELEQQALEMQETRESMLEFSNALDHANFAEFDALKVLVEEQIEGRNLVTEPLAAAFNDVTAKVNNVLGIISDAEFELASKDIGDFSDIATLMSKIGQPMEVVASILKPVEWLLDSVGFVVDLVLGPIFDFITKTLGIDKLLDKVADEITALLPDADFLEPMLDGVQDLLDTVRDFDVTNFGIDDLQLDIDARLYGATVGNALLGPTGIGDDSSETLFGDGGDDILDARGGDDIVQAGGGNDVIVAGEGNDLVFGGDGTDMVYFGGFFNQYELAKDTDGKIIVTHVRPGKDKQNEGSTKLDSIEHVVFANISFTGAELENSIIGGSVLNGTKKDDLLFLNSSGTPNSDGQHVANGLGGDDRIFGSADDDEINGGNGDDVLLPGLGDDEANGGNGSDTYQVLEANNNNGFRIDLQAGTLFGGYEGSDQLNSIENLILQGNGDHFLYGSSANNNLLTAGGDDVVAGRGGNDFFNSGEGKDVIITGAGKDRVLGGDHNDFIIAASATVAGQNETFDGGRGFDALSYSTNYNYIRDLISPEINKGQQIRNAIDELTGSTGSVRIDAGTGTIEKLDASGTVVATDTAVNVSVFLGSDADDVLTGASATPDHGFHIHGADGDDTLLSNGARQVTGGDDDDTLILTDPGQTGFNTIFDGGSGHDILDLRAAGNVRWQIDLEGSIGNSGRAYDADFVGNLRSGGSSLGSINIYNVNEFFLGHGDNLIENDPKSGSILRIFHTGKGDDEFFTISGQNVFDAGGGDDTAHLNASSTVFGGLGDDRMFFDNTGNNEAYGGNGSDWVTMERFGDGIAQGGKGFDTLVFDTRDFAMTVDLKAGTAAELTTSSFKGIEAQVQGFERVVGSDFSDSIAGGKANETLIGRAGNDTLDGRFGDDQLFGGAGNDTLLGSAGADRLHGGAGNDILNGGKGRDTAVYSYAAPDGLEAQQTAGNFGGVTVNLALGVATGSFGSDTLLNIEDVVGSGGNDTLTGDNKRNVLSGEAGDDVLFGKGGDDVLILGSGMDTANGGFGDDRIIIGAGSKDIDGSKGMDRLEFGTETGKIALNFNTQSFSGSLDVLRPVWLDTGTSEARLFNGVLLTPQQVKEAQAVHANSFDDLTRVLPDADDPEADLFRIVDKAEAVATDGVFSSIETVVGGKAEMNIVLSIGTDQYDGTNSDSDYLNFGANKSGIKYNLTTGFTNFGRAKGDDLQGIDGLLGGSGKDRFTGDSTANKLAGGGGNDSLFGGQGADLLLGGFGKDTLFGGNGKDTLKGGAGGDTLNGGKGIDVLIGGAGQDILKGGKGGDRFVFENNFGLDRVVDFQDDLDQLDLSSFGFNNVSQALSKATEISGDTHFDFGGGDVLAVEGMTKSQLADDILI